MDGASKFVRGDAVAGLLIMVINVVGATGRRASAQHGFWSCSRNLYLAHHWRWFGCSNPCAGNFDRRRVIVTRVSTDQDVGQQMVTQLFNNPRVMVLSASVLGLLGMVPGMPNFVFLLFTAALLALAWRLRGKQTQQPVAVEAPVVQDQQQGAEATWADVQLEDPLGMEVGYRLIPMVDFQQNGELLGRIRSIRKNLRKRWATYRQSCIFAITWNYPC